MKISVVVPFFNEEECAGEVCEEILQVLSPVFGDDWELIAVDDGSEDSTGSVLKGAAAKNSSMRTIHSRERLGQSAALKLGFSVASGKYIGTLDGDGQNDPADLPLLLQQIETMDADMVSGIRVDRHDNWVRRMSSKIANGVRSTILKDKTTDVGCSMRVFRRHCLEDIHLFRNFHRFFPALLVMNGFAVAEVPVNHRPRFSGTSKYGGGINSRLWVGLADLAGVYWLSKRVIQPRAEEDEVTPVGS
ncbi:MAG: glycosyltransferase family 2 protein [bacterium]|nr:glycosyltransferase family 2 protein [bacterium]